MFRNRRDPCASPAFARMTCLARYGEAGTDLPCHTAAFNALPWSRSQQCPTTALHSLRYKLQVTLARETHEKLRRAQALARHTLPGGDVGSILDRALTLPIDDLERRRFARVASPRPSPGERYCIGTSHTGGCQACSVAAR